MLLTAALNGNRQKNEHAATPITPEELAVAARQAVKAGAGALHLHPRNAQGEESLEDQDVRAALNAVRATCPDVPVGISSAYWILPDPEAQLRAVHSWTVLPDFVSVNWHEPHALVLARTLLERGIGIEAGLWREGPAQAFLSWPHRERVLRIMLELPDHDIREVTPHASRMLQAVEGANLNRPVLLHGHGQTAWPLLREAARLGLAARIGLEDVLTLPNGQTARDNAELVQHGAAILNGKR